LTTKQITGSTFLIAPTNDVAFTGEGRLVRKATGYEQEKAEAALSHIGFAGWRELSFRRSPLDRSGDPQISPTRQKKEGPEDRALEKEQRAN
jgi:hypothetical protein